MRTLRTLCLIAVLGLAPSHAAADMLQLDDGRAIDGPKIAKDGDHLVVHFENGDVRVPLSMVADYLIEGGAAFEPRTEEEKAKRDAGLVPFEGDWVKPAVRAAKIAKKQAEKRKELESYLEHTEWRNCYKFETKNFRYESVVQPWINDYLSGFLEAYYKGFGKIWKTKVPKDWGKLAVFVHKDIESFRNRGGAPSGALAYYRFVAPRELHFFWDRRDPEGAVGAMFHECSHYLQDLIEDGFQYPHWIGEAMAEYFSGSKWDPKKKKLTIGEIQPGRLVEVRSDIDKGKRYELSRLIGGDVDDYEHYYWGWSFVHFMMETPKYRKNFQKYIIDIARGKGTEHYRDGRGDKRIKGAECMRIFKKRMGVKDIGRLEAEWYEYIDSLDNSDIRGLERAGLQAYSQGRLKFRAHRLLKAAIDQGSTKPLIYIRYGMCLLAKGEGNEAALEQYRRATEIDPLDGASWAYLGYHLKGMGQKEEGDKIVALAKEISPDEDFLWLEVAAKYAEDD